MSREERQSLLAKGADSSLPDIGKIAKVLFKGEDEAIQECYDILQFAERSTEESLSAKIAAIKENRELNPEQRQKLLTLSIYVFLRFKPINDVNIIKEAIKGIGDGQVCDELILHWLNLPNENFTKGFLESVESAFKKYPYPKTIKGKRFSEYEARKKDFFNEIFPLVFFNKAQVIKDLFLKTALDASLSEEDCKQKLQENFDFITKLIAKNIQEGGVLVEGQAVPQSREIVRQYAVVYFLEAVRTKFPDAENTCRKQLIGFDNLKKSLNLVAAGERQNMLSLHP